MAHLIHDVLIKLKDGSTIEDSITDEEAFLNIKAGNKIFISKCSGNFIFGGQKVSFTGLTSQVLKEFQDKDPTLIIEIVSCQPVIMDLTDIHEFESFEVPIGETPTTPPPPPPITEPPPITPPIPPPTATKQAVSQSLGTWQIFNDRVTGEILFIASTNFPPSFYGIDLNSFVQIKDKTTNQVLVIKRNTLNFTLEERDERLFFDEAAFGNTELKATAFVWTTGNQAMSQSIDFDIGIIATTPPVKMAKSPYAILPFALISALLITDGLRRKGGKTGKKTKKKR